MRLEETRLFSNKVYALIILDFLGTLKGRLTVVMRVQAATETWGHPVLSRLRIVTCLFPSSISTCARKLTSKEVRGALGLGLKEKEALLPEPETE